MTKNFMKDGKWIDNPNKVIVHVCKVCEAKFIKTRDRQTACLPCFLKPKRAEPKAKARMR